MENTWEDFEKLGQKLVASGRVIDEGGDGSGEMSAKEFESEGQEVYSAASDRGMIANDRAEVVAENRDDGLQAAFRQGLIALDDLSDSEKIACLENQNAILKSAIAPPAPSAATPAAARQSKMSGAMTRSSWITCDNSSVSFR